MKSIQIGQQRNWRRWLIGGAGLAVLVALSLVAWSLFKPTEAASGPVQAAALETSAADATVYTFAAGDAEASFLIDEVLRGEDVTVVGTTDQVAGELSFNFADTSTAQLGTVRVNVRDLATDSEFRDRAIKNQVLLTDDYEYVSFTPTEITGLPESVSPGDTFEAQITGDLTITDATLPVTFDAAITVVSEGELTGTATTNSAYEDFGLTIPFSQSVDAVSDTVTLELDFTAQAQG